jgi:hypothetical protein
MTPPVPRIRIGRWNDPARRQIVYQTAEALEVDEIDHFEIARKRVFFDDVQLVTMHRQVGKGFVVAMAVFAVLFGYIAIVLVAEKAYEAAKWFGAFSVPFLVALFLRTLLKQDVITVYGRRSRAGMRFTFRKTYAQEKFEEICSLARDAQAGVAAQQPPPAAPPPEYPMPPAQEDAAAAPEEKIQPF